MSRDETQAVQGGFPPAENRTSVDLTRALKIVGNDRELLNELFAIFRRETPRLLQTLQDALAGKDAEGLSKSAHRLKGSLANIGAEPAQAMAHELERIGREKQLDRAPDMLRELANEIRRVEEFGAELAAEPGGG